MICVVDINVEVCDGYVCLAEMWKGMKDMCVAWMSGSV